jgi:hypothetical protein
MSNSIVNVFPNTDLRSGHDGLRKIAVKSKKNPGELQNGEFLLFINKAQSAFKMFAANNTIVHYKSPVGLVDIRAIEYLPSCFNGGTLNYDVALAKVLEKTLGKRFIKEESEPIRRPVRRVHRNAGHTHQIGT